jgi:hypothetical protein
MPLILGANSITGGYEVDNSLRFNSGSADTLSIDMGTSSSRRIWTLSTWIKLSRDTNDDSMNIVGTGASDDQNHIGFDGSGSVGNTRIALRHFDGTSSDVHIQSNMRLNDQSAWYHVVYSVDTTQGTDTNRVKIYVNGTQVTSLATSTYPSQNFDWDFFQNGTTTYIGRRGHSSAYLLNGYLAETVWIDGTQLDPTSFGEFDEDSGIWKPIDVSGLTFGDAGFYLEFKDSSALGDDTSGNSNDFTVNNLTSIDQTTDTPTNNFATMNPLVYRLDAGVSLPTYSDGNTTVSYADDSGAGKSTMGTICFDTGKWYWEYKVNSATDTVFGGITRADYDPNDNFAGRSIYYNKTGALSVGTGTGGTANASYGNTYTTADIISVAFDCVNGVIWFAKNGTWQNSATQAEIEAGDTTNSATTGITLNQFWSPFFEGADSGFSANFGNPPFTISSGNSDGNGYGNFEYAVPSGYYSLNTKNLAEYG